MLEEDEEIRRRWAAEVASRIFHDMEAGTAFCKLAKEIEDYAKSGAIPKDESEATD